MDTPKLLHKKQETIYASKQSEIFRESEKTIAWNIIVPVDYNCRE
jgi:hypothetical protein